MSIVNANQNIRKKDEEEEQKRQQAKVVGQQQKEQPKSDKPVGSTSIPRDNQENSRTQKSAASSLRRNDSVTTIARAPRREESKTNIIRRNTFTANRTEQQQNNRRIMPQQSSRQSIGVPGADMLPRMSDVRRANMSPSERVSDMMKEVQSQQRTNNPAQRYKEQTVPNEIIDAYAKANNMSFEQAKSVFDRNEAMRNQTITKPGQLNEGMTNAAQAVRAEQQRKANQKQISKGDAFMVNMGKTITDPLNVVPYGLGKLTGNDWDLVGERAREEERLATEQHPIVSAAGDIAGFMLGNKILRGGTATKAAQNAGDVAKRAFEDAVLEGGTKGQAILNGLANGGRAVLGNALREYATTDLPLDTIPYIANGMIEGKSNKELLKDTALNVATNVGFNGLGDALSVAGVLGGEGKKALANSLTDNLAKSAIKNYGEEAAEQAAKETAEELAEQSAKNTTPFLNEAETLIQPNINKALGTGGVSQLKDVELSNLARLGGADGSMEAAYSQLLDAVDSQSIDEFKRALSVYEDVAKQNNVEGLDDTIKRLNTYIENGMPDVETDLADSVGNNVSKINSALGKLDNIGVPPSKLGNNWLDESHKALANYQDAINNGGDVAGARKELDRVLGNLDKQAKKLEDYDGSFSQYKGMGTLRGDLYLDSEKFPKVMSPEEEAFWNEQIKQWDEYDNINRFAVPANKIDDAVPGANNLTKAPDNVEAPKVETPEMQAPKAETPEIEAPKAETGNFLDDFARSQETKAKTDIPTMNDNVPPVDGNAATKADYAGKSKVSQARTNVFERSGIDEAESKNIYKPEDYKYVTETNEGQLKEATDWLNELGDDAVSHYAAKDFTKDKATIKDVDSMMMLTEKLRNAAREATSETDKKRLYAESRDLSIKSVQAASQFGKDLQSWSKWANTPERVVDKGYGVMLDRTEEFFKHNKRAKWGISDVSNEIEELFKKHNIGEVMQSGDKKAIEALKREISTGIDDIIKGADKQTRKALQGLSDGDIEQLMYERGTKSINQALEMYAGTGSMGLKDSTVDAIFELMAKNESLHVDSKAFVDNEKKIYAMIANDISRGGTFGQKIDSWRYLSMLANPSTHLRNVVGNITMEGMSGVKNDLAAVIESAADRTIGIDRTKALLNPYKDAGLLAATKSDAINRSYRQLAGHRYNTLAQGIESEVKAFNNKGLGKAINKASDINSGALSAEDEFFKINEYSTALAGYLKANGFDESILDDGLSKENQAQLKKIFGKGQRARLVVDNVDDMKEQFLQDARAYAVNKAQVQTYNNANEISNRFSTFTKGLRESDNKAAKALGFALDVTIPFKSVPANILNTAIAYSPAEWVKVLSDTNKLAKGSINAAEYIDEIATATTGTVAMLAGAYLAHEGMLEISSGKGTKEKAFDKSTDKQNDSIKIAGHNVDLVQLIPSAAPLIYGAMVYGVLTDKNDGLSAIDTMTSGLSAIADGVTDMTMLQGIADILKTNKYSEGSVWGNIGSKIAQNAASQMVPTVGGKIEKTIDGTQRNSWYTGKEGLEDTLKSTAMYNISKLPGAQKLGEGLQKSDNKFVGGLGDLMGLQPRINSKGEEMQVKGGNALGRAFTNISPLEVSQDRSTETDNKLRELAYKFPAGETRDNLFPYAKQSEAKFNNTDGEQVVLDPKQWTEYQKNKGQMTSEMLDKFLNSQAYESMDDATRADTIKNMYDFAEKYNQHKIADGAMTKDAAENASIYESEGMDGLINSMYGKAFATSTGLKGNTSAAKDIQASVVDGNMEEAQEKLDIATQLADQGLTSKGAYEGFTKASTVIPSLTVEEYANTRSNIDADSNDRISQDEMIDYYKKNNITSEAEAAKIADAYGNNWTTKPKLVDGEWDFKKDKTGKTSSKSDKPNLASKQSAPKSTTPGTGNNDFNTLMKAKQKAREDAKANAIEATVPGADDLPEAATTTSGGLNWQLNNGYDLSNTQTYQRAKAEGVSDADFNTAWWAADVDGNGYMKKAEAWNYAKQFPTEEEQQKWFRILYKPKGKKK